MHNIAKKRLERGWTQSELAERSGVSQSTISQIESGERKYPRVNNIKKIAEALETSMEELIDEKFY
ncbi:HTH-type transcriptional regulator SinR [compost metagenome]